MKTILTFAAFLAALLFLPVLPRGSASVVPPPLPSLPPAGSLSPAPASSSLPVTALPVRETKQEIKKKQSPLPVVTSTPAPAIAAEDPRGGYPARLTIPSIGLDAPVEYMGLNSKGEMDVPAATTSDVGWYAAGTVPGAQGSAVMDAHVFAAFKNLKNLRVGAEIFVTSRNGSKLRFVAEEAHVYPIAEAPVDKLFSRSDAAWLNLITCAGGPTPDGSTYTHRLIVYGKLAE